MLQNLIYGVEKSQILLLEDYFSHSCLALLKCTLKSRLQTGKLVHFFCFENPPETYLDDIGENTSNIKIHNCYADPLSWDNLQNDNDLYGYELCKYIDNLKSDEPTILIIDSLSYVLLHNSASDIYKSLDMLKRNQSIQMEQIICFHVSVHSEEVIDLFEHLATSIVRLSERLPFTALTIHKKSTKIIKEVEEYYIINICDIHCVKMTIESKEIAEEIDPTANLTFNLQLKESEKNARENLVLPYTKVKEGSSNIYFEPEDEDFEDPDDDLDI
ncbi:elongator complex protein 5-like [Centruroides sculpturatus]|uniref:elongator complex protein 5-like n=1 Tax=Centruroides sculpturatus TaxID=218467 RepID=UPI000C6D36D3|nr:elongator complex protein 5-like [Centruroides sculpturatus]